MEAAERFAAGASNAEVAKDLRVSVRSVQRWRRDWQDAGTEGLRSAGPVSRPKLDAAHHPHLGPDADIHPSSGCGDAPSLLRAG
ncbi:helix-turn-helix domain-containing protein [Streptomyces collinus]|uniref:helix-turn-helix domain-containing protein n=1 Tax=Streptomyces collinus TaxID=42684 RepID=UPI0036B682F7